MKTEDAMEILDRLWEHFDRTSDIDDDGGANPSLVFCTEINEVQRVVNKLSGQVAELAGALWDVCLAYEAYRVRNGEDRDSSDVITAAREVLDDVRGRS